MAKMSMHTACQLAMTGAYWAGTRKPGSRVRQTIFAPIRRLKTANVTPAEASTLPMGGMTIMKMATRERKGPAAPRHRLANKAATGDEKVHTQTISGAIMKTPMSPSMYCMFRRQHNAPYTLLIWLRPASLGDKLCGVRSHRLSPAKVPKAGNVESTPEIMLATSIRVALRSLFGLRQVARAVFPM